MITASDTAEGAKGLMKDGGFARRTAAEQAVKSAGARLDAFYFAFGDTDAFVIVDAPDHASIAAASVAINQDRRGAFENHRAVDAGRDGRRDEKGRHLSGAWPLRRPEIPALMPARQHPGAGSRL